MKVVRVGSRESKLAVIQSEIVINAIKKYNPEIKVELITMKTTGDKILDRTLDKIGGKGLFVKELDLALISDKVDITVHSSKDLPMDISDRLPLVAISEREDPRDVLVLPLDSDKLDKTKPIGCSSARRAMQLKTIYPDMSVEPVRGNVITRIKKLDQGDYSALVLAAAGLHRLGLKDRISRYFSLEEILPAAGQGILAVQSRSDENISYLSNFHNKDTALCLMAERAFVRELNGGCSSPIAAYAFIYNESITITGMDIDKNGKAFKQSISGEKEDADKLGKNLAHLIKEGKE